MQKQNAEAECGGKNKVSFIEIIMSVLLFCSYASAQSVFDEIESSSSKKNGYGVVKSPSDRKSRSGRSDRKFRSDRSDRSDRKFRSGRSDRKFRSDRSDRKLRSGRSDRKFRSGRSDRKLRSGRSDRKLRSSRKSRNDRKQKETHEVESLRELEKFDDIAVIQKKYLDKSDRFEASVGGSFALNSQFYNFLGLNVVLNYHINETFGIELEGLSLTDSQKNITASLDKKQHIVTKSIVVPKSYLGAHIRWSPIYGKISLRERTINPFEMYFTFGGGISSTDDGQSGALTVHIGMGQFYPMTKNTTFKWSLGYNFFRAGARDDIHGSVGGETVNTGFLYFSTGISVFLPFSKSR